MRQNLPAGSQTCDSPELLSMRLGEADYVVDLDLVTSICPRHLTPALEGPSNCLRGVKDAQGQFVPVLDLRGLLGQRPETGAGVIVILGLPQQRIGLLVDAINDMAAPAHHGAALRDRDGRRVAPGTRGRRRIRRLDLQQLCLQSSTPIPDDADIHWQPQFPPRIR
jgi:hypothetical protein